MNRDDFLLRVRTAARAGRGFRVAPDPAAEQPLRSTVQFDLVPRMAQEVTAVGGEAHVVETLAHAREILERLLEQHGVKRALCWSHPVLDALGLEAVLSERGIDHMTAVTLAGLPVAEQRTQMLSADAGITSADFAVAETGTLALSSAPGRERLASLAPPLHVAIITRDQILPDLFDVFAKLEAIGVDRLATNLVLITGPSKTGDLELQLTTGVHGPKHWHVIIVDAKV